MHSPPIIMLTPVRAITEALRNQLSPTVRQEIADKLWTLDRHFKADGKGLITGTIMEQTVFEVFTVALGTFEVVHEHQSDCAIMGHRLSFKKVSGKSQLALQWSKNPTGFCGTFEHPILLLNLREGKWWRRKSGWDRHLPAGFFVVDHDFCNTHVCLKRNNKSDSVMDAAAVYTMLVAAMDTDCFVALPPPREGALTFSFSHGFLPATPAAAQKWPTLPYDRAQPRFIDLFCGVGGFHYALTSLGGRCVFACDSDAACRDSYRRHFGIEPEGDIRAVRAESIPPFDILCAGFPCQPFSKAGDQAGFDDQTKGHLFFEILRILRKHEPAFLMLENVPNLVTHDQGKTWATMRHHLAAVGYPMAEKPVILSPLHVGTPQSRPRAFLLGALRRALPPFPIAPASPTCIRTILCVNAEETTPFRLTGHFDTAGRLWEGFCERLRTRSIAIPHFPIWSDDWDSTDTDSSRYMRYRTWIDKNRAFYRLHQPLLQDWLHELRAALPNTQALRKLEWQCDATSLHDCLWTFRASGLRARNLDYSPTLVAMANTPVFGPEWRFLTPRELCRLQDFPDTHHVDNSAALKKQMGNAVSVRVAREIAQWLLLQQNEKDSEYPS
ncbi:DNA (cytosine-5-)-methyltransferase [bacterium]|nr:DNA (cytosine-5-)-methyltransferase [bacterium]